MTVGVGGEVARGGQAPEVSPEFARWHTRAMVAFGGAVVAICVTILGTTWIDGLRPSTLEALRADVASGAVTQWYAASSVERGALDLVRARPSSTSGAIDGTVHNGSVGDGIVDDDGDGTADYLAPDGFPDGGILVWTSSGRTGWQVASGGGFVSDDFTTPATEETTAIVRTLRVANLPMVTPPQVGDLWLVGLGAVGGLGLFAGLLFGAAPRLGTRWFWFWMMLQGPLVIGFIAYAVVELIGVGRRSDRPLNKRYPGIVGLVGAAVLNLVFRVVADVLRSRGVPIPL